MSSGSKIPTLFDQRNRGEESRPVADRFTGWAIECVNVNKSFIEVGEGDREDDGADEAGSGKYRNLFSRSTGSVKPRLC